MYICDFSRSDGAGNAITRNTRGLTFSVIDRIVPPLPAASRPSKMMITRKPLCFTHSCMWQSSACSFRSSFMYCLLLSLVSPLVGWSFLAFLSFLALSDTDVSPRIHDSEVTQFTLLEELPAGS